tara:strand:- start:431 stop:655 length:225 start_codon:yes stop_codon:yes gene_type:complete
MKTATYISCDIDDDPNIVHYHDNGYKINKIIEHNVTGGLGFPNSNEPKKPEELRKHLEEMDRKTRVLETKIIGR